MIEIEGKARNVCPGICKKIGQEEAPEREKLQDTNDINVVGLP
jgi:hypothetical protein